MLAKAAFVASALAAFANAQTISTSSGSSVAPSSTVSQAMPPSATQGFILSNTTMSMRSQWCLAQTNNCPQICGGVISQNTCDSTSLNYTCVCQNGTVPDCTAFMGTVPFFVCQTTYAQCVISHPNDQIGQGVCANNEKCGTRNATAEYLAQAGTSAVTSATASRTSSASSAASSAGSSASSSASASSTAKSDSSMTTYTSGAFVMVLVAAFKLLL